MEIHGAISYLIHQFLADNTNRRSDVQARDRTRFAAELVSAASGAVGGHRLGLRISPGNPQFGMTEHAPAPVHRSPADAREPAGLAYLPVTENKVRSRTTGSR